MRIRSWSELCAVQPDRPLPYNEAIINFGLSLLNRHDAWAHKYSPLDILKGILQPDVQTMEFHGKYYTINRLNVNIEAVAKLRIRVIDKVIRTLSHGNARVAVLAARSLDESLRYPMDVTLDVRRRWMAGFAETLRKIESLIQQETLEPLVLIQIADAVSWHAYHDEGEAAVIAKPDSRSRCQILISSGPYSHL